VTARRRAAHNQSGATAKQGAGNEQQQNLQQRLHEFILLSMSRINALQHTRHTL
jgi:hypothetical protein